MKSFLVDRFLGASRLVFISAHLFRSVQVRVPILSRNRYILRSQHFAMRYIPSVVVLGVFSLSAHSLLLVSAGMVFSCRHFVLSAFSLLGLMLKSLTGFSCALGCLASCRSPMLPSSIPLYVFLWCLDSVPTIIPFLVLIRVSGNNGY